MANKTINELTSLTPSSTSEFAIYQNGSTGKATMSQILGNTLYADDEDEPTGEVEFTSADDSLSPSSTVSVDLLSGNDSWGQRFTKVSQMFKNIRYLLNRRATTFVPELNTDVCYYGYAQGYYDPASKTCRVYVTFASTVGIQQSVTPIVTVPAQYRPSNNYGGQMAVAFSDNTVGFGLCKMDTNGNLTQVLSTRTDGMRGCCTIEYAIP